MLVGVMSGKCKSALKYTARRKLRTVGLFSFSIFLNESPRKVMASFPTPRKREGPKAENLTVPKFLRAESLLLLDAVPFYHIRRLVIKQCLKIYYLGYAIPRNESHLICFSSHACVSVTFFFGLLLLPFLCL